MKDCASPINGCSSWKLMETPSMVSMHGDNVLFR